LGLEASGTPADDTHYLRRRYSFWRVREIAASIAAVWDIYVTQPLPVLGEVEPIFPN
jgi:vancomycin permeability regulator SanA